MHFNFGLVHWRALSGFRSVRVSFYDGHDDDDDDGTSQNGALAGGADGAG